MENKYTFQHVAQQMTDLQDKKNKEYGNAYFENLDEENLAAARIAIGNKWRRFNNLSKFLSSDKYFSSNKSSTTSCFNNSISAESATLKFAEASIS